MSSGTKVTAKKSGKARAAAGKTGKAQVKSTFKSPTRRGSAEGAVAREKAEIERALHFADGYRGLADQAGSVGGEIRALVWEQVKAFPPIRIRSAQDLLGVSDHTIGIWCRRGILELSGERPKRVSLDSVLRAQEALQEIRAGGQDRDLTAALLNRLELDELRGDERFRASLAQAKRGERAEWPEGS